MDYAFYVVGPSTGKLFPSLIAIQTDAVSGGAPVTLASVADRGPAGGGTTTFSDFSLNATRGGNPNGAVFELNAVSSAGGTPVPDISLGLGNFDGMGNVTSYSLDENIGGTLSQPSYTNAIYSVDKTSGRVTLTGLGTYPPVWYLVTFNTGFVVGTDPNVTTGTFEPQTVSQPVTILSLFGNFYGGTVYPVLPSVTNEVEAAVASPPPPPGSGNGNIRRDLRQQRNDWCDDESDVHISRSAWFPWRPSASRTATPALLPNRHRALQVDSSYWTAAETP